MAESTPFEWLPEYDEVLEKIASTDKVETEWTRLKDMIKYKLDKSISLLLLSQSNNGFTAGPVLTAPRHLPSGGLKLPPFLPRPRDANNPNEALKATLTEAEAQSMKDSIFTQIDALEGTPFSIQRLCELCLYPRKHYRFLGKYLRAVERSVLVTSTWDAFPVSPSASFNHTITTAIPIGGLSLSAPPTPMFSPIPFLHDDARRSRSRSPPPSPLTLAAVDTGHIAAIMPPAFPAHPDQKALGLVDELDDPSPGHLSDHPRPLSATTIVTPKPVASLEERFVRSSEEPTEVQPSTIPINSEEMAVDDPEKENRAG